MCYDGNEQEVGYRFQNVNIPQGATVIDARLQFRADEGTAEGETGTIEIAVFGEDTDNSPKNDETDMISNELMEDMQSQILDYADTDEDKLTKGIEDY